MGKRRAEGMIEKKKKKNGCDEMERIRDSVNQQNTDDEDAAMTMSEPKRIEQRLDNKLTEQGNEVLQTTRQGL